MIVILFGNNIMCCVLLMMLLSVMCIFHTCLRTRLGTGPIKGNLVSGTGTRIFSALTSSPSAFWTKLSFSSWTSSCPAPQRNNFLGGELSNRVSGGAKNHFWHTSPSALHSCKSRTVLKDYVQRWSKDVEGEITTLTLGSIPLALRLANPPCCCLPLLCLLPCPASAAPIVFKLPKDTLLLLFFVFFPPAWDCWTCENCCSSKCNCDSNSLFPCCTRSASHCCRKKPFCFRCCSCCSSSVAIIVFQQMLLRLRFCTIDDNDVALQ